MKQTSSTVNTILAITACLLWSTAFAGVKIGLQYMSPLMLAGLRFMLAGLLLLPFCGGMSTLKHTVTREIRTVMLVCLFQSFLLYGSFFIAMQYVGGAVAAIVIGSSPLMSALTAHVLMKNDKLTARNSLAIALGITGITIVGINCKPWSPVGLIEFFGILVLLFGSLVSAIGNVIIARKENSIHPVALNCAQIFTGGVLLSLTGIIFEGLPSFDLPVRFYAVLIWLASLSAVAFSIWFNLLGKIKVSKLNVWKFLIPVFGALTSWLILPDESPTVWAIVGLLFVTAGVITANREGRDRKKAQTSPRRTS